MKSPLRFLAGLVSLRKDDLPRQALPEIHRVTDGAIEVPIEMLATVSPPTVGATSASDDRDEAAGLPVEPFVEERPNTETEVAQDDRAGIEPFEMIGGELLEPAVPRADVEHTPSPEAPRPIEERIDVGSLHEKPFPISISRGSRAEPSSRTTIVNDAVSLDAEIIVLRRQLWEKLKLQNAQLRKMLERFEVH